MGDHFINVCSCGVVLGQCRCPDPNKKTIVTKNGCEACKAKAAAKSRPVKVSRSA